MKASYKNISFIIVLFVFIYGCGIKKHIPEDKRLYTGASIEIEADSTVQKVTELKEDLAYCIKSNNPIQGSWYASWLVLLL